MHRWTNSKYITKHNGVSKIFSYGLVSYSNKAKSKYLSVSKTNLSKFGAVSKVAEDMVNGFYENEKTQILFQQLV